MQDLDHFIQLPALLSPVHSLSFSSDVPFTNGKYTPLPHPTNPSQYPTNSYTFKSITSSSITSDSSTPSLPSSLSLPTSQIRHSHSTRQILNPTTNPNSPPVCSTHLPTPFTLASYIHRDSAPLSSGIAVLPLLFHFLDNLIP